MLCSFNRIDGMVIDYAGTTLLAFTDIQTYYLTEPTDVNYYYKDESIAKEYQEMNESHMKNILPAQDKVFS